METEQNPSDVLLKDWMQWWNDFDGDTWAYEFAQGLIERTKAVLKKEGKDHSVYLLHIHDIDGAERYFDLPTATEFAEEFYSDDNDYYTAQKIELESEDEYKGFMKAFSHRNNADFDTLDICKHEYDEIKTVEENHA
jgi:lipoate-protein ligase A